MSDTGSCEPLVFFCFLSQVFNRSSVMRRKHERSSRLMRLKIKAKAAKIKNLYIQEVGAKAKETIYVFA